MGVTITTKASSLTIESHRVVDRAPDGRLWVMHFAAGSIIQFWYSDNDGDNWAQATGNLTGDGAGSLFVDLDGGLHVVYEGIAQGFAYRRGTVSGSTITWTPEHGSFGNRTVHDLVAFRDPGGSGWWALMLVRSGDGDNPHLVVRTRVVGTSVLAGGEYTLTNYSQGGSGFSGELDFHHTGDGKTVQGGTPHVYVSFKDSAANNHYIARLVWNGSGYVVVPSPPTSTGSTSPSMAFDGTRVVFALAEGTGQARLFERDAQNTATTDRGLSPALGAAFTGNVTLTYDRDGNVYLQAIHSGNSDLYWVKWTRGTATWAGSWTAVITGTFTQSILRKGWAFSDWPTVEGLYIDATNLIYQEVAVVNAVPNAPAVLAPADGSVQDVAASLGIIWQFNDPDQGDTQTAYTVRKRIGAGAHTYWNGTTWAASESGATKIVSAVTSLGVASGWGADGDADHYYSVKTWDALDQLSPWSAEHRVIPSGKDNPTITIPVSDGTTVTTAYFNAEWTVATQSKYRLRVIGDTAGTPNPAIVDFDSGIKISTTVRLDQVQFPTNGQDRQIELTTWNDEGLASTITYRRVVVSYTPPANAAVTLNVDTLVSGAIVVTIANPGSGAAEDHNDLFRREVGDTGAGIRIAVEVDVNGAITDYAVASGVDYEYQAKTYATTGAISFSPWVD